MNSVWLPIEVETTDHRGCRPRLLAEIALLRALAKIAYWCEPRLPIYNRRD